MFIFDLKFSNLHLGDHGVLHGWSLSNKLLTRTLLQEKYTRLNDPELVLAPDIVPSSLVFRIRILGHPGAVSRVDKMFVVKVYCKIEHFIDPTYRPWVSEDGKCLEVNEEQEERNAHQRSLK